MKFGNIRTQFTVAVVMFSAFSVDKIALQFVMHFVYSDVLDLDELLIWTEFGSVFQAFRLI